METNVFFQLSIVIAVAAGIALFMRLIKQPLIIGYILTGVIVGPFALNIIESESVIDVFASIGIALLLFIIGLGLNPKVVKEVGKVAFITGSVQILLTTIIGFAAGRALGWSKTDSVFAGLCLAFSSTIIILKLLSDRKDQTRLYGKITIGVLLLQDIVAAGALILVNARSGGSFSVSVLAWLGVKAVILIGSIILVGWFVLPRMNKFISSNQEFLFLFAIGWGFGAAALFEFFGFSIEIGALFAGIALAGLPYSQEVASRLRPLRDFFIVVFFIVLGTRLNIINFNHLILTIVVFVAIVAFAKPLIVMVTMGILGYTKKTSFKTAGALAQISEFSLVFVLIGHKQGLVSNDIANVMTIVALITIASSTYAILYSNRIYNLFESKLRFFERSKTHQETDRHRHYDMVLLGYKRGGREFVKVMQQLNKKYVVIDYDPEIIEHLERKHVHYLYGDVTDLELMGEINLNTVKLVVSSVSDYKTNVFLLNWINSINPRIVFICNADHPNLASELYGMGASYVILPHYIGSEKISSFIKKNGFNKTEFKHFREKHLEYLEKHYS